MDDQIALKLESPFELTISVSSYYDIDDRILSFDQNIWQSKNKKFIAIKYRQNLCLIEDRTKIIMKFQSKILSINFSEDSKYCAIFLHDEYKLLMLYNLEERKMVFVKKINFFKQQYLEQLLNFYQDSIIMTSKNTIQSYSLKGEERFQLERDQDLKNTHVKINDKLFLLSHSSSNYEVNSKDEVKIFSSQSCKKLRTLTFISKIDRIYTFSQNLLFFIPCYKPFLLMLRETSTNKIIRKYKHKSKPLFVPLFQTDIFKNEIRGFDFKYFYKINISQGCIQAYKEKFLVDSIIFVAYLEKGVPFFGSSDQNRNVWKKNHQQKSIKIQFFEIKV